MAQKTLDTLFDTFLSRQSLFLSKTTLQEAYTPENVPHREEQIAQLANILAPALRGEKPSNVFIYGKTGTGKTLVSKFVCQEIGKRALQQKIKIKPIYINCKMEKVNTSYRLLANILTLLGKEIPPTGLPTDEVYKQFVKNFEENTGIYILVLDEIDALSDTEILYNLTRINTELKETKINIVGISNDLSFTNNLDPRIKSSLSEEELVFPPYNAIQIQDILTQRAKIALRQEALDEAAIPKCAALAAHEHGDARRALDLLRVACEIAERNGDTKVTIEHVDSALKKLDIDKISEVVKRQPRHSQLILCSIIYLKEMHKEEIATGVVFEVYQNFCRQLSLQPLTPRRVSDLISELDMLGVINTTVISKGRYGRTRKIKMDLSTTALEKTKEALKESGLL